MIWRLAFMSVLLTSATLAEEITPQGIKICKGSRSPHFGGHADPIPWLRATYENCTHINYHLVIRNVKNHDISFLDSIAEVYGSVVISNNEKTITLPNLTVIRGSEFFSIKKDKRISLFIRSVIDDESTPAVYFPSLRSIAQGNVDITGDASTCYMGKVNWTQIFEEPKKQKVHFSTICSDNVKCNSTCKPSDACWGPDEDMCQDQEPPCKDFRRCYIPKPKNSAPQHCNEECIGGCVGPLSSQCMACKNFIHEGTCHKECDSRKTILDRIRDQNIENPNYRYRYKFFCVKQCPEHLYVHDNACVRECPRGSYPSGRICNKCDSSGCPDGYCSVTELVKGLPEKTHRRTKPADSSPAFCRSLMKRLENCTFLWGDININPLSTFAAIPYYQDGENVRAEDLVYLSKLKHLRGYMYIDLQFIDGVHNLSFLSNLESVDTDGKITFFKGGDLTYLGLKGLKDVRARSVFISSFPKLCYMENFENRFGLDIVDVKEIKSFEDCKEDNQTCDEQCDPTMGCWGPGPTLCLKCKNVIANDTCVKSCKSRNGFYTKEDLMQCGLCHEECKTSCNGPGPHQCERGCKHFNNEGECVKTCPLTKYADKEKNCRSCAAVCKTSMDKPLCTGPSDRLGFGGCNECANVVILNETSIRCMNDNSVKDYQQTEKYSAEQHVSLFKNLSNYIGNAKIYIKCHDNCDECLGLTVSQCISCHSPYHLLGFTCKENCSEETFPAYLDDGKSVCKTCHRQCSGCRGPSEADCLKCKTVKIYTEISNQEDWYCGNQCPEEMPHKIVDKVANQFVCSNHPEVAASTMSKSSILSIAISIPVSVGVFGLILGLILYYRKKEKHFKFQRESIRAKYTRKVVDDVKLETTDQKPDSSLLKVIGVNQIEKKQKIGAGAFGTVYAGIWTTPHECPNQVSVKIKIAIKELNENGNKKSTEEFLSEARLMASVDHDHCMKLIAVCLTSEPMLISEYMPIGNLRDYLQHNKDKIGSQSMLRWALQIAKGMTYLNNRGIVHRDLAARNVLLESEDLVRITDFGLAKLTESQHPFQDRGQKLPIRWLAIECIKYLIFSTKSDVWAYGVTLWEIFSFGEPPYPNLMCNDIFTHLMSGERLPQPMTCTLDMYMVLIKCWLGDAESRPTFDELIEELKKMAADPGRYLIIENDILWKGYSRSASIGTALTSLTGSPRIVGTDFSPFGASGEVAVVNHMFSNSKSMKSQADDDLGHYVADPTLYSGSSQTSLLNDRFGHQISRLTSLDENEESVENMGYEIPNQLVHPAMMTHPHPFPRKDIKEPMDNAYVNTSMVLNRGISVDNPEYV